QVRVLCPPLNCHTRTYTSRRLFSRSARGAALGEGFLSVTRRHCQSLRRYRGEECRCVPPTPVDVTALPVSFKQPGDCEVGQKTERAVVAVQLDGWICIAGVVRVPQHAGRQPR